MWRSRLAYLSALLFALLLHLFYAEAVSFLILLLLLCLPVFSLLISIPLFFRARVTLHTGASVRVGQAASLRVGVESRAFLPAAHVRVSLSGENLLNGTAYPVRRVTFDGSVSDAVLAELPTAHCGVLRFRVKRATVSDYLGLFAVPIRRPDAVGICVLPREDEPSDVPAFVESLSKRMLPKRGGGFSEEHELRPYRDGDSVSSIHWKLSSKLDELIIREPMEIQQQLILCTLDLYGAPDQLDDTLHRFSYLMRRLLEAGISPLVRCPQADKPELQRARITSEWTLNQYLINLCGSPAPAEGVKTTLPQRARVDRQVHIFPSDGKEGGHA